MKIRAAVLKTMDAERPFSESRPLSIEELELDEDVADLIRPALRARFTSASEDDSELDLELLDLKFFR